VPAPRKSVPVPTVKVKTSPVPLTRTRGTGDNEPGHEIVLREYQMLPVGSYHRSFCSCEEFRSRPCGTVGAAVEMYERRHLPFVRGEVR